MNNILYIGPLHYSGTCFHRMRSIQKIGCTVYPINSLPPSIFLKEKKIHNRLFKKILGPIDFGDYLNNKIISFLNRINDIDMVWIDKGLTVYPTTLLFIKKNYPKIKIIGYSPDYMLNKRNQSKYFLNGLKYYDFYFTTKSYSVKELKYLGASKVYFISNGFSNEFHFAIEVSDEDKIRYGGDVGFIGNYELDRALKILYLANNGIKVRIFGSNWHKWKVNNKNIVIENKFLNGLDYTKSIRSFKINLAFLSKQNRDLQTTRSVEIPACKGFMLAERTIEHLDLFKEKKEAEFFDSNEELLYKTRYYLSHEEERLKIADNGYMRCILSGYSNDERIKTIFDIINNYV